MKKGSLLFLASALAACGAAAVSNDAADSATQRSGRNAPPSGGVGFQNYEQGGMAGCFDPNLSGYARAAAERAGGVPCQGGKPGAAASSNDAWLGAYTARVEGGTATMSIGDGGAPGRYRVGFEVTTPSGCSGEVDGTAVASGNRLSLIVPVPESGSQCRIDIERNGARLAAQESECFYFHGAQCEFSGSYVRQGGAGVPPRAPAQRTQSIIGAWAYDRRSCETVADLTLNANGTYYTSGDAGRWSLAGGNITFVTTETYTEGGVSVRLRSPRRSVQPVRFSGADRVTIGGNSTLLRC